MGDSIWHYLDSAGTQVGPVSAQDVAAAVRAGRLGRDNLVWRDGMMNWQPLREMEAEFGLASPAFAAPPAPPAQDTTNPYDPMPHAGLVFRDRNTDIVYAGFVRRWAAMTLDRILLAVPLVLAAFALGAFGALGGAGGDSETVGVLMGVVYLGWFVLCALYYALQESSAAQATLGKRALGIKVTDTEGRRLGFGQALGRWFATLLSYLTLYIGFLMAAFTQKKQALHDMAAGTLVVDQWAYTDHPERQRRGLSGCLIAFLIAMAIVPIIAIFAAIAISQYQDYVVRSQVSEGASLADGVKTAIGEYINNTGEPPANNEQAGLAAPDEISGSYVASVDVGQQPGRIDVTYSAQPPFKAHASIDGSHLYFISEVQAGTIVWTCASDDLEQKNCPSSCTCTGSH